MALAQAYHHPRAYATPGGDIAIMKDSRNGSIASGVGAALGVPVDMSSWWSSWSKESSRRLYQQGQGQPLHDCRHSIPG